MTPGAPTGVTLASETFGAAGDIPIVLVMGLGAQMLLWPDGFCAALAERGHFVVRFDNRDVGASTRFDQVGPVNLPRAWARSKLGLDVGAPYSLTDMALDTLAVMDAQGLERATVVGASMGGMIVQRLAVLAPDRLDAWVSVMSAPFPAWPRRRALAALLKRPGAGLEGYVEHTLHMIRAIGSGSLPVDEDELRALAGRMYARGPSPAGFTRQFAAILADGDRTTMLAGVKVPGLVIHGDEDPLIPLAAGIATAKAARVPLRVVRGMGHDLPRPLWPEIVGAISEHARAHRTGTPSR